MSRATVAVDVAAVALFVGIGRASHHHAASLGGFASTAWPFAVGLVVGWIAVARRAAESASGGVTVCLATVVVGMTLRVIVGQGTAVAFIVVAVVFLGAVMVGGRLVCRMARVRSPVDPP